MVRTSLLHVAGALLLASCAGAFEAEDAGAGRHGSAPGAPPQGGAPATYEVAAVEVQKEGVPLEDCRSFERFVDLRDWLEPKLRSMIELGPEWRTSGLITDVGKDGRLWVAWAEGYNEEDERVEQPRPRPWSACALPGQLTSDIPSLSYGASPMLGLGLVQVSLLDEAVEDEGKRPRREFTTVVDLRSARAMPRSLCYLSSDIHVGMYESVPSNIGCQAKRECDVHPKTGELKAGKWQAVGPRCEELLESGATAADLGFGTWKFSSHGPNTWL